MFKRVNNVLNEKDEIAVLGAVLGKDSFGRTALHRSAWAGHTDMARVLIARGAGVNDKDMDGRTALHLAARAGHADTACALIKRGADIHAKDMDGRTPQHLTTSGEVTAVIREEISLRHARRVKAFRRTAKRQRAAL